MHKRSFRPVVIIMATTLLLCAATGEIWARATKTLAVPADRYYHPYLMIGGFFHRGFFPVQRDPKEIPEAFGYRKVGVLGVYQFDFQRHVSSATERGSFLYRDRAAESDPGAAGGAKRFFIVGGSVAFGEGASAPERRWFAVLEKRLRDKTGELIRSIPAANHSYNSTQERVVSELYVWPKKPDALVILDGFNDTIAHYESLRPGDPFGQGLTYRRLESPFFEFLFHLSAHSELLEYLMGQDMMLSMPPTESFLSSYADSMASVYLSNIEQMKHRCTVENTPCYFFLQPCRDFTARTRGGAGRRDPWILRTYDEILRRIGGFPYLHNLTGIFDTLPAPSPFIDDAHFNDKGHDIVGNEIARVIAEERRQTQ